MENSENIVTTVNKSRRNSTTDDNEEDVWLDFLGIAADPPDRREKCEYCQ